MQNEYKTSDFGEVTLAVYHGYEVVAVDQGRRATFTIEVDAAWRAILDRYERGQERVEPKRWGECSRAVKSALYDNDLARARREAALARAMRGGEVSK